MKTDGHCEATLLIGPWQANTVRVPVADKAHEYVGLRGLPKLLNLWMARHRQRRALAALPERLLRDIGLSAETAQREAAKPFWRA